MKKLNNKSSNEGVKKVYRIKKRPKLIVEDSLEDIKTKKDSAMNIIEVNNINNEKHVGNII